MNHRPPDDDKSSGIRAHGTVPETELDSLLLDLRAHDKDIQVLAANALAQRAREEPAVRERLLAMLADPQARTQWGAAYALNLAGTEPGLDCLAAAIDALGTADGDVRWAAAELLLRIGRRYPGEVRDTLLEVMAGSDNNRRKMALYCLRDLGPTDSEVLSAAARAAMRGSDPQVRLAALAFVKRRHPAATEIMIGVLERDSDAGVRRAAASALASSAAAFAPARAALQRIAGSDADPSLSRIAERALRALERAP